MANATSSKKILTQLLFFRGPVRLFEDPDDSLEKDNFEWLRRTPSFEY